MKKIIVVMLSVILLVASLVACQKTDEEKLPDGAVEVLSGYPNLEYILPGEYDTSKVEDSTFAKYGFSTFVSEVGGQLALIPSHTCGSSKAPYIYKSEVYKFGDISGGESGVFNGDELLIPERCVGMVHSYDLNKLLVITTTDSTCTIYSLSRENADGEYVLSKEKMSIEGEAFFVYYEWDSMFTDAPEKIYVVSDTGVVLLQTDEYLNKGNSEFASVEVERLASPSWWKYIKPNNATQVGETVWLGERNGVVGISPDGSMKYYPIDYLS